jgi:hypothetical protein
MLDREGRGRTVARLAGGETDATQGTLSRKQPAGSGVRIDGIPCIGCLR